MESKAKSSIVVLIIVALLVLIGSSFVPVRMGIEELTRLSIQYVSIVFIGIGIVAIICLLDVKNIKTILILFLGIMSVLGGSFCCYNLIKGVQAGPQRIETGSYSVYAKSPYRGSKIYCMKVLTDSKYIEIKIDKSTYEYLKKSEADVKISYYPYINVADEIVEKPHSHN